MVVNVQTCGLHRRSMNAPTMLIHKYIYLWPTKINHGYTVGATIGRLISNYLNCFSSINQQPKLIAKSTLFGKIVWLQIRILNQTNSKALFGKESCQRSWLRDWIISAPFTNSILINSQAIYILPKQQKSRGLSSSALFGSHSWTRRRRPRRENCTLYSFLFPAFTPLSLRSPTPSWLTVKLYILSLKQQKSRWLLSSALFGSHSWTRTNDILINSQALYRLSYAGIFIF